MGWIIFGWAIAILGFGWFVYACGKNHKGPPKSGQLPG